jgi:hypothetical protein
MSALLSPVKLLDGDKLAALRRLDQFREWRSLDDRRYCISCGRLITGREIHAIGGSRGTGPLRVICPTRNCNSIPMDSALPTEELLAKMSILRVENPAVAAVTHELRAHESSLGRRLRRFATEIKSRMAVSK